MPFLFFSRMALISSMPPLQEKRSSYAPTSDTPVRYDGVYRIRRCWRKPGNQKQLMCRSGGGFDP